ncbi:MAG: methyl-accepting chemotaxis protein [Solirubrobacterales bacterium]
MEQQKRKSLKSFILVSTIGVTFLIFIIQALISYQSFSKELTNSVNSYLQSMAEQKAGAMFKSMEDSASANLSLAQELEALPAWNEGSFESIYAMIRQHIAKEKTIYGSGFWLTYNYLGPDKKYFGPYVVGGQAAIDWEYNTDAYDYPNQAWYKTAIGTKNRINYTEPYYDAASKVTMITSGSPLYRNGKIVGCTTADFDVTQLRKGIEDIEVGKKGFAFVITQSGYTMGLEARVKGWKDLNDKNEKNDITKFGDTAMQELGQSVAQASVAGITEVDFQDQTMFASYAPIGTTGLKLVLLMPRSEALAVLSSVMAKMVVVLILALILFAVGINMLVSNKIGRPLNAIVVEADRVSQGDLTEQPESYHFENNEIGFLAKAFQAMAASARGLIAGMQQIGKEVTLSAQELAAGAEELSATSEQVLSTVTELAKGSNEQAKTAQEGNLLLREMIDQLSEVASSASASEALTSMARDYAHGAADKVSYQKVKMAENRNASNNVGAAISVLSDKSRQIGEIVNVISEIADLTNLLALNAAIEAARAGEQGRGFAVVAQEVRSLAEQSSQASKEISDLIKEIQSGVAHAVGEVQNAEVIITEQEHAVDETTEAFQSIFSAVEKVATGIREVAQTASAVSQKANTVGTSIQSIASITEESAAGSEEVLASYEQEAMAIQKVAEEATKLATLTAKLERRIALFKI